MKKYLIEILLVFLFLIANIGIMFYFDNEIRAEKAGQMLAKANENTKIAEDKAKKAKEEIDNLKEESEKQEKRKIENSQNDEQEKTESAAAKQREKKEKERKKLKKKERNEQLGIHKYKVVKSYYIDWETANDRAVSYADENDYSKSYLLHIDSLKEWSVVEKKLSKDRFWYFIGGRYDYGYSDYVWVDGDGVSGYIDSSVADKLWFNDEESGHSGYVGDEAEDYIKLQYSKSRMRWMWLDVTNENLYQDENTDEIKRFAPEDGAYIIEYEE